MRRGSAALPPDIEDRLAALGGVLEQHPAVHFAYLFGGAGRGDLRPLSDVDVAVYLDKAADAVRTRLELIGVVSRHLGTDEVDLVVLNGAATALVGRILRSRRVIVIHEYARVDAEVVISILRDHLGDLRRFETEALGWLKEP